MASSTYILEDKKHGPCSKADTKLNLRTGLNTDLFVKHRTFLI